MKHIAFDLGAESGRAIVGQIVDGKLQMEELHRFPTLGTEIEGTFRWDIYALFDELKTGLKKYAKLYGDEVCTMGVDTWGVDYGYITPEGEFAGLPYHYRDKRNVGTEEITEEKFGQERLYNLTGIQAMQINTLNQLVSERRDGVNNDGNKLLFIGDLLHFMLCGSVTSEYSIATTSNMFSTISDKWQTDVLGAFDIEADMLPRVLPAGSVIGTVHSHLAEETEISPECKVIAPPIHDTASAIAATPSHAQTIAYISSGTWSLVGLELENAVVNDVSKSKNIGNLGGAFGKKIFLNNVMGLWLIQRCRKSWMETNPDLSYGKIVELAEDAQPFFAIIKPNEPAFLNPDDMPTAICDYMKMTGQTVPNKDDIGQIARIIFESLALSYRNMFEAQARAAQKEIEQINILGGGIQNKMLTRFTADATNIRVVAGPIEATATGNILMQAFGSGEIGSLNELRQVVMDTFEPEEYLPNNTPEWESAYKKYCEL